MHSSLTAILTDVDMPFMDGITATKEIRKFEKDNGLVEKPIIILTGNSTAKSRGRAKNAGANEFLTKPLNRLLLAKSLLLTIPDSYSVLTIDDD
jgi:CheY-like chemotaxis protein